MSLPATILQHIYDHYQAAEWGIITLNEQNEIIHINPKASQDLNLTDASIEIKTVLPLLATESLNDPFFIPFYNHNDLVFDVHFLLSEQQKYLILFPIDMVHKQVQYKQQLAHDQAIEKLRLQYLFSALENAHKELKEANSAKSFYISALSHEMGNPLNAIKGYNELLGEANIDSKQATRIISKNVAKLEQIIAQTLDYDQQQSSQHNTSFKPAEYIEELFNDFKIQAHNKGLDLNNCVDDNTVLTSNRTKWGQIFTNLISNAIKYTETGNITVSSMKEDGLLHIDVADTGCGMSPDFQKQLFTAWSREGKSASQGNGIGLVISKMLAEQIGASLNLHTSDATGSCFRFTIAYHQTPESQKILLVDDDHDCLNLFEFYLTQAGHQVSTADSISSLKNLLHSHTFDTLITDFNLGDGQVDSIFNVLRPLVNKAIIMTANPSQSLIDKLNAIGFDQILCKPLTQDQLVNSVS